VLIVVVTSISINNITALLMMSVQSATGALALGSRWEQPTTCLPLQSGNG